jgi:hypothetical protein
VALRGRHQLMLWLLAILAVLWVVAARQTSGFRTARALADARRERAALEGRRADVERRIREAESRRILMPRAQGDLRLRQPADSEIILLPAPPPHSSRGPGGVGGGPR